MSELQRLSRTFPPPIHSSDPELSLGEGTAPQSRHWPRAVRLRLSPEPLCSWMNSTLGGSLRTSCLIRAGDCPARHRLRLSTGSAAGKRPPPGEAPAGAPRAAAERDKLRGKRGETAGAALPPARLCPASCPAPSPRPPCREAPLPPPAGRGGWLGRGTPLLSAGRPKRSYLRVRVAHVPGALQS